MRLGRLPRGVCKARVAPTVMCDRLERRHEQHVVTRLGLRSENLVGLALVPEAPKSDVPRQPNIGHSRLRDLLLVLII